MKISKENRRKIYLKVAKEIAKLNNNFTGICAKLDNYSGNTETTNTYPEFKLFSPSNIINEYCYWFDTKDERIICMLLCSEMCN